MPHSPVKSAGQTAIPLARRRVSVVVATGASVAEKVAGMAYGAAFFGMACSAVLQLAAAGRTPRPLVGRRRLSVKAAVVLRKLAQPTGVRTCAGRGIQAVSVWPVGAMAGVRGAAASAGKPCASLAVVIRPRSTGRPASVSARAGNRPAMAQGWEGRISTATAGAVHSAGSGRPRVYAAKAASALVVGAGREIGVEAASTVPELKPSVPVSAKAVGLLAAGAARAIPRVIRLCPADFAPPINKRPHYTRTLS